MRTSTRILLTATIGILSIGGLAKMTLAAVNPAQIAIAAQQMPRVAAGMSNGDGETQDDTQANQNADGDQETQDDAQANDHPDRIHSSQTHGSSRQGIRDRADHLGNHQAESPNGDGDGETNDDG